MLNKLAQELKEKDPETVTRVHEYNYVNKTLDLKISTNWCVLIYGPSGDDVESIKEAIRKYVLDNSTHTETEWKEIFPDIFSINEFILINSMAPICSNVTDNCNAEISFRCGNQSVVFKYKQTDSLHLTKSDIECLIASYIIAIENAIDLVPFEDIDPEEYGCTGNEDDYYELIHNCIYNEFKDMIKYNDSACSIYNVFIEECEINKRIER